MILVIKRIAFFALTGLIVSCTKDAQNETAATTTGKGGSLAKFTIAGNYLYSVDNSSLFTFDISNPLTPVKTSVEYIGNTIETIYPFKNRLFIGGANGMYIYSIDTPSLPTRMGTALHVRSCDPVVANDSVAFVTLKGNTLCGPAVSGLYINNVSNLFQPVLRKVIEIESPEGLAIHDTTLYVCNNDAGLKIYNITDPFNPVERKSIIDGSNYRDAIPYQNLLICFVSSGIVLYNITDPVNPVFIKQIAN